MDSVNSWVDIEERKAGRSAMEIVRVLSFVLWDCAAYVKCLYDRVEKEAWIVLSICVKSSFSG